MFLYFLQLAVSRIFHKKKSSVLSFLILFISFSFIIVALSIVGSISKTNAEYRLNTYGEWLFAILPADDLEPIAKEQEQVEKLGKAVCCGTVQSAKGPVGIGTVDDSFLQIGRIAVEDGHFPETETEIAMEASTLSALGYDYTLGQEITLYLEQQPQDDPEGTGFGREEELLPPVAETFTLCGVIREFSSLWCAGGRNEEQVLVSAFVTPEAARSIAKSTGGGLSSQIFLNAAEENREIIWNDLTIVPGSIQKIFLNTSAYPSSKQNTTPEVLYVYLIGAVSLVAVFSVFFLQMRDSYHSYAVCRSIGMTKKQLALLLTLETLLLVLPAIILGTLLGGALTFLLLRLLMYSGSAPVQVDIPAGALAVVIFLWVVCTVACRLILFFVISRAQLTGAFQLSHARSVKVRRMTKYAIFCLTALFGTALLFTGMGSLVPAHRIQYWSTHPAYAIYPIEEDIVPESKANLMAQIPGLSYVKELIRPSVAVSVSGMEEISAFLYCIEESDWDEIFDFGGGREAFHNGDLVLLTFKENRLPDIVPPDGTITLHFLSHEFIGDVESLAQKYDGGDLALRLQPDDGCITEKTTPMSVRVLPSHARYVYSYMYGPYSIICSEKFLKSVLSQMNPGQEWGQYVAGGKFGYYWVDLGADLNSGYLSTDVIVAKFCRENNLYLFNERQEVVAYQQEELQELIFLLSSGGCISVISLLLLCNLLQLEAAQEEKSFAILRMIGMSKKQVRVRILSRSIMTCLFAAILSALFYAGYTAAYLISGGGDIVQLLEWVYIGDMNAWNLVTPMQLSLFLSVCVIVPLACCLIAKLRAMKKEDDFK